MTSSSQAPPPQGPTANRSVARAIWILRALAASDTPLTVTDVAKAIGLPRATAFRILMTLEEEGIVDRQDTLFSVGWDLARIALSVDPAFGLVPRIRDLIEGFAEEIGETVTFSLRRGRYELDLVLQSNPRLFGMTMSDLPGKRWHHHASATGKLLLAALTPEQVRADLGDTLVRLTERTITDYEDLERELDLVRRRGWSGTIEELEDGVISFAAPVRDSAGALIGALSFVGPVHRLDSREQHPELIDRLLATADDVRHRLNASALE